MKNITDKSVTDIEKGICVIKFWAIWCGPCQKMNPIVEIIEKEFSNINFFSVDIDEVPSIAQKYRVRTLPTLLVLNEGVEVARIAGLPAIDSIRKMIRESAP